MSNILSSSSSSSTASSLNACNMDDIEYLLHLEALKRFRDDEKNIRRQIEEQTIQMLDHKLEYVTLYEKYVKLLKHIGTRHALVAMSDAYIDDSLVESTAAKIAFMAEKTSSAKRAAYLDETVLDACKSMLANYTPCENLCKRKEELAQNRDTVKAIQTAVEHVETSLEAVTVQGMQQLTMDLNIKLEKN